MKKIFYILQIIFLLMPMAISFAVESPDELKNEISEKTKKLDEINKQLKAISQSYEETQDRSKSLKKELGKIDNNIKQLNLYIKSGEINAQKINLEIESLSYKIEDAESKIASKREVISSILRQMNESDDEDFLITMMKNESLAASIIEAQNLADLSTNLSSGLIELKKVREDLSEYFDETSGKKNQLELENRNLKNRKSIIETQKNDRSKLLTETKNQEKVYAAIVSDLEKQQQSISDEIEKIENELRSRFDISLLPSMRPGVFSWPLSVRGIITQHFGEKSYLYRGNPHNGFDIAVPIGTPVFASADGKIIAHDDNDRSRVRKYQYGEYVLIEHVNNLATLYAHLESAVVSRGDVVKRGDLIGYSGNSGYSTGAHLHFGAYWAPSIIMKLIPPAVGLVPIGVTIDPEGYL